MASVQGDTVKYAARASIAYKGVLPAPARPKQFDLKSRQDKSGAGFNQFDPVLTLSGFISRRFGLAGGLALVALLAATEGNEILKAAAARAPPRLRVSD